MKHMKVSLLIPGCTEIRLMNFLCQIVLLGDHKQLRPIVECAAVKEMGMKRSLLERYMEEALMLDTQYRMVLFYTINFCFLTLTHQQTVPLWYLIYQSCYFSKANKNTGCSQKSSHISPN